MLEVKIIYSLEWCVQSVSVVGYSPEYMMLCCVAGALSGIQSNLSQYLISILLMLLKALKVPEIKQIKPLCYTTWSLRNVCEDSSLLRCDVELLAKKILMLQRIIMRLYSGPGSPRNTDCLDLALKFIKSSAATHPTI